MFTRPARRVERCRLLRLYDYLESGNGYKVRLLLARLGVAYERIELDIVQGESRTPGFLAINPNGRIPTLVLDDGSAIAESGAILYWLARDSAFWPEDPLDQARVLQWMFFEQYSHEPYIAVLRHWVACDELDAHRSELAERRQRGEDALDVMENHLAARDFFVGDRSSIADIALYAYTHVAEEGGYDLSARRVLRSWLDRVADEPGHIPIDYDPMRE